VSDKDDYVLCMECQKSFPMDDCQPFPNKSGYGFVYCHNCFKILNKPTVYLIRFNQKKNWQSCKHYYAVAETEAIADRVIEEAKAKYPDKVFWKRICKVIAV